MTANTNDRPTLGIVIPAFNEADTIVACLDSLANQKHLPDEIVIVNNNSSDDTAKIAARHRLKPTVLDEPKQGIAHARNAGFNAITSDVIVRIDADSMADPDWLEAYAELFRDESVDAAVGSLFFHDIVMPTFMNLVDAFGRKLAYKGPLGRPILAGANMAIRTACWHRVNSSTCISDDYHEDVDLTIHLEQIKAKIVFEPRARVATSIRMLSRGREAFNVYVDKIRGTYAAHGDKHYQAYIAELYRLGYEVVNAWPSRRSDR